MQEVIELNRSDAKKILAEYYGVPLKDVLVRKYSFVVIRDVCEQERYLPAYQTGQIYERTGIGEANE